MNKGKVWHVSAKVKFDSEQKLLDRDKLLGKLWLYVLAFLWTYESNQNMRGEDVKIHIVINETQPS